MKRIKNTKFLIKRIKQLLLLFAILCTTSFKGNSLTINGPMIVCTGESHVYTLTGAAPNTIYQWTIYKSNTSIISTENTLMLLSNNEVNIQWMVANGYNGYTINVTGGGQTATYDVLVLQTPKPYITTDSRVGCQEPIHKDHDGYGLIIVDDQDGCVNVCEHSTVNYTAYGQTYSYFEWHVTGGVFSNGQTTITGSPFPNYNAMNNVQVVWGGQGNGNITVIEHSNFIGNCPSVPKTVCMNIIERPKAMFTFDNKPTDYPPDWCYDICLNQTVYFTNLSTYSLNSPIISYEWDFGDNTYSQLENPSHQYTSVSPSGSYWVTLKVTNKCGCIHTFQRQICVSDLQAAVINCPSVICENQNAVYRTESNCNPYIWTVIGGSVVSQNDPEITIFWDNIGSDGFGYLSLDGSSCEGVCPYTTTVKIPVVQAFGTIDGPTDICMNKNYKYQLPAWPATNYRWSLINSNGSTFVAPEENSHEVWINAGVLTGVFTLKCNYVNTITECSGYATIDINVSDIPVILNPPKVICVNNAGIGPLLLQTSIAPNSANYIKWTIINPNGTYSNINGTSGSSAIYLAANYFSIPGLYTIKAHYSSGVCDPEEIRINVKDIPPPPTYITGENTVCTGYPYSYNGDLLQGTVLSWAVSGGTIVGSNVGNSVTVIWNNVPNKTLTCYRAWDDLPDCISSSYSINISSIVLTGSITPPSGIQCQDGTYTYSITTNYTPETYEWSITPSIAGSVGQGQGTNTCSITWNHTGSTYATVSCKLVKCATLTYINQQVQISGAPTYSLTASPNPACSGEAVSFSLSSNPPGFPLSGASFNWNFGDNTTATTPPASTTHSFSNYSNSNSTYPVVLNITNGGCGSTFSTVSTSVEVKPSPVVNISPGIGQTICTQNGIPIQYTINLTSSVSSTVSYQWHYNGSPINGANSSTLTLTNNSSTLDGIYTLVVTASNGCSSVSNPFVLSFQECSSIPSCTPVTPFDYPVLSQVTPVNCRQAQCTSVVTGSSNNIWTYEWIAPTEPGYTGIVNANNTITSSPVYGFDKPGLYWIAEEIHYKDAAYPNDPSKPCIKTGKVQVLVPLVADFTMHVVCNGNNNGYLLSLKDHSAKYYNQTFSTWEWFIDNSSSANYTTQNVNSIAIASGTHTIKLKVTLTGGHYCETTQTIAIPALPVANFTVTSTDPQSGTSNPPFSSCSGNAVVFNNTSTVMADLVNHVWDFSDGSSLHKKDGVKVYTITTSGLNFDVSLTVTDKYGCTNNISKNISILNNSLYYVSSNSYNPMSQTICSGNPTAIQPISPILSGGYNTCPSGTPNCIQSQWYYGTDIIGNVQYTSSYNSINLTSATASGAYWVKVTDAHGCYVNINPKPSTISIKNAPTAIIEGKQNYCFMDETRLKAISGINPAAASYAWVINPGNITYNTQEINLTGLSAGNYTAVLTVTDIQSGCSATSGIYPFTVHNLPSPAVISVSPVDCDMYHLQLQAITGVSPAYFNWSSGQTGQLIDIYHGGAYRLWLTDQYGCQSISDIEIPASPETYFWRFPLGCYTFCPGELPKWVDSDKYKEFEKWFWYIDGSGNIVSDNGPNTFLGYGNMPYQGSGNNSICDRLLIDLPPNAMGSGKYNWALDNGLCYKESGVMDVRILESCCNIEIKQVSVDCIQNGLYSLFIEIENNTPGCANAWYNISVLDPATNLSIGIPGMFSPSMVWQGNNQLFGTFQLSQFVSPVTFKIEIFCNSYETCIGYYTIDIPECGDFANYHPSAGKKATPENIAVINADMQIMPNPAKTSLTVSYRINNADASGKKLLKLFDITGRPVKELLLGNDAGIIEIDVSSLAQGMYFVELSCANKHIISKRLIIQH